MTDSEQVKAALAALANGEKAESTDGAAQPEMLTESTGGEEATYRRVIERAVAATEDIEAAATFVESVGLDRLEAAVDRAEHEVSGLAADGREALAAFERYRVAAAGPRESDKSLSPRSR